MKWIVKNCENHNDHGGFTGNLCNPCYQFITAGKGNYSQAYRNANPVELTDKEIKFIAYPFESVYTTYDKQTDTDTVHARFDQLGFARAILRKAQEK